VLGVPDRLLVSTDTDVRVQVWRSGEQFPLPVGEPREMASALGEEELEDLRWYLEESLIAPFAVYGERGAEVESRFPEWGERLFTALFGESGPAREAYVAARTRGGKLEVTLQSDSALWLGLPWELMRDPSRPAPLVLDGVAVTRRLPSKDLVGSRATPVPHPPARPRSTRPDLALRHRTPDPRAHPRRRHHTTRRRSRRMSNDL
jgi:hypothetical protein